ncbi:MAG: TadE/TadG family type IV pilus assembly protein [Candidatus Binataceae bacterium]
MNSHTSKTRFYKCGRHGGTPTHVVPFGSAKNGQAAVELALLLPLLLMLLLAAADFGRLFYMSIELDSAARAGAQYGSRSVITAADINGMESAVRLDGSNIAGIKPLASQCTCVTPAPARITACPADYCRSDDDATFVKVTASAVFNTLVRYPGIPSSVALNGVAIMQVQQ